MEPLWPRAAGRRPARPPCPSADRLRLRPRRPVRRLASRPPSPPPQAQASRGRWPRGPARVCRPTRPRPRLRQPRHPPRLPARQPGRLPGGHGSPSSAPRLRSNDRDWANAPTCSIICWMPWAPPFPATLPKGPANCSPWSDTTGFTRQCSWYSWSTGSPRCKEKPWPLRGPAWPPCWPLRRFNTLPAGSPTLWTGSTAPPQPRWSRPRFPTAWPCLPCFRAWAC